MTGLVDDLKTAAALIEKAKELVEVAAKTPSLPSEAMRQSVREEVGQIRLKIFLLRHHLTTLHATANRRKSRKSETDAATSHRQTEL